MDGLRDRSSRPLSSPNQIPLATANGVENSRRERRTQEHIAAEIGISTGVSRILKRRGLSRLSSLEVRVLNASTEGDLDSVFANLVHLRADGLVISGGAFFFSRIKQLAALSIRHGVPAVFQSREFVAAGDLLSYGSEVTDAYPLGRRERRQAR